MSALPPKADICSAQAHVRFGSLADISSAEGHVRFTPNSDRESEFPQKGRVRFNPESGHSQARQSERSPDLPKLL